MKRIVGVFAAFLLVASSSIAADLSIKPGSSASVTLTDGTTINMVFSAGADGSLSWIGALGRDQWFSPAVNGGTPTPAPTPVPTPTPDPTPLPPTPAVEKLRVAVFIDNNSLEDMPEQQRQIVGSFLVGTLREWSKTNCLTAADGSVEWRNWPATTNAADVPSRFSPLVVASNGVPGIVVQRGESGPVSRIDLPANSAAVVEALEKLAGPRAPPKLSIISDENYRQLVGIRPTGYLKSAKPSSLPKFAASYPLIPRSQWKSLVAEGRGTWLGDVMRAAKIPAKDQASLGYCWVYASASCVEAIRALQGQPFVSLSPESIGGPVTGWRNQGGWGQDALAQLLKVGCCESSYMDAPNSLRPRRWKDGWEANCALHKITEAWAAIDDGDFDAVFTAALLRLPVSIGLDWWGHQVIVTGPVVFDDGTYGVEIRNSWGEDWPNDGAGGWSTLTESKSQPSGSFACVSVGASDRDINASTRGTAVDLVRVRQKSLQKIIAQYQHAN